MRLGLLCRLYFPDCFYRIRAGDFAYCLITSGYAPEINYKDPPCTCKIIAIEAVNFLGKHETFNARIASFVGKQLFHSNNSELILKQPESICALLNLPVWV